MPRARQLLFALYHLLWLGIDLILPPVCGGCGAPGFRWCHDCQARVTVVPPPHCVSCGSPVVSPGTRCHDCTHSPPSYTQLRSWAQFADPVRSALHRLKYRRDMGIGEALAGPLCDFLRELHWQPDIAVPVPLGRARLGERGYNQSALIAWPLSLALGIALKPGAVRRCRETGSQVGLTRKERRENVRDAFRAVPHQVKGRRVLLVDDVATTGATLSSCAEALFAAGARDVFALTVARALRLQPAEEPTPINQGKPRTLDEEAK